jgi:hypothetical protein
MQFELREYAIVDGRLDDFVREWTKQVLPLRVAAGFSVLGPWVARDSGRFVWLLGYDGDLRSADAAYSRSPERRSVDPDPGRLVVETQETMLEAPEADATRP